MKINKELVKKGFKNQLIAVGHMITFNIISFIIFGLSNIGIKPTGNVTGSIFAIREYKANLFLVLFCWLLFLILFSIFYTKFLKRDFKKQIALHWIFAILFLIFCAIFCFIEVIILLITHLLNTGIFSAIVNYPNIIYILELIYIIGNIVIDIIKEIKKKRSVINEKK